MLAGVTIFRSSKLINYHHYYNAYDFYSKKRGLGMTVQMSISRIRCFAALSLVDISEVMVLSIGQIKFICLKSCWNQFRVSLDFPVDPITMLIWHQTRYIVHDTSCSHDSKAAEHSPNSKGVMRGLAFKKELWPNNVTNRYKNVSLFEEQYR